jgi:hypothetical protein
MSSATVTARRSFHSDNHKTLFISVACTANADGTFDAVELSSALVGFEYWLESYRLANAWAKNPASNYPTAAAVVTITDSNYQELVGAIAGDTLTLSTAASGLAQLSVDRSSGQRIATGPLTLSIADTGAAANSVTINIVLERF